MLSSEITTLPQLLYRQAQLKIQCFDKMVYFFRMPEQYVKEELYNIFCETKKEVLRLSKEYYESSKKG